MNVAAIRDALKTRLATVTNLRAYDTIPASDVATIAAVVVPDEPFITYPETIARGQCTLNFKVTLLASGERAQDTIDGLLSSGTGQSTSSAVEAIVGDRDLGDTAQTCVVTEAKDYGITDINGTTFWKADLHVTVTARRA